MRLLWHSNPPWANTGYGAQTRQFAPRIRDLGHEVAISAFWGLNGAVFSWGGMTVFPGDEDWGNRLLPALAEHWNADLVMTLMDVWVLRLKKLADLRMACWVPVDHEPCPPKVVQFFEWSGAKPIAMSKFGQRMLSEAGLSPLYVPHGVDTTVYRPLPPGARARTRQRMGIPEDAFVVGMTAANKGTTPPRKAFPQVLQAFSRVRKQHKNAFLYLHCDPLARLGLRLGPLAESVGIPEDAIRYTTPLQLELGIPDEQMAELYAGFDVLANPSYGEGFGVPIIEAQACGIPVIVTDCTAMSELCGDGWAVGGDEWYDAQQSAFYTCPSVDDITQAMLEAYEDRGCLSEKARDFAVAYDADRVTEKLWRPALAYFGASSLAVAA